MRPSWASSIKEYYALYGNSLRPKVMKNLKENILGSRLSSLAWEAMFAELKKFKAAHRNCNVPVTGVVNRIHTFLARTLFSATQDKEFEQALDRAAATWTKAWDEPKYLTDFLMPHSEKQE
jgi:hypothetical protein